MDYLNIGANGFAQVGDQNYCAKNKIEMKHLLELIRDKFSIPEELKGLCHFAVKAFPHDFGTYHEIVLHFDDDAIGDGSNENEIILSDDELQHIMNNNLPLPVSQLTLHDIFWDWFHPVESFDMETEEITEAIKTKYLASLNMEKREHLDVKRA